MTEPVMRAQLSRPVPGRRTSVALGPPESPVVMDYLKARRAMRVRVGNVRSEIGLGDLFTRLGIDAVELAPARRHLLFAAAGPAAGGVGDLVGVFDAELDGRQAFARLRQDRSLRSGWAELCAIDLHGRVSILCSFGGDRPVRWPCLAAPVDTSAPVPDSTGRRRFRRPSRRSLPAIPSRRRSLSG